MARYLDTLNVSPYVFLDGPLMTADSHNLCCHHMGGLMTKRAGTWSRSVRENERKREKERQKERERERKHSENENLVDTFMAVNYK